MPNKTLKYYKKTLYLKIAALATELLNKGNFLETYKRRNQAYFEHLFDKDFSINPVEGHFSKCFLSYAYFNHPAELARHLVFDSNGIPLGRNDVHLKHHNPLIACYYGLVSYNHYLQSGMEESKEKFFRQVDFLNKHGVENERGFWLPYLDDFQKFHLKAPWYAGITQALAISVFIRAFLEKNDPAYKLRAQQLYQTLFLPTEEGGFLRKTPEGNNWIEEYPSEKPSFVLNGFVFCLVALTEYFHVIEHNQEVEERINKFFKSFFYSLHHYIFGRFTKYGLNARVFNNIEYQGLYVFLFLHLYRLTGKESFCKVAVHFDSHTNWKSFFSFYQINAGKERVDPYLKS